MNFHQEETTEQLEEIESKYHNLREEKARIDEKAARVPDLEEQIKLLQDENSNIKSDLSRFEQRVESEAEKQKWLDKTTVF